MTFRDIVCYDLNHEEPKDFYLSLKIPSAHSQEKERPHLQEEEAEVASQLQAYTAWNERTKAGEERLLPILAGAAPSLEHLNLSTQIYHIDILSKGKGGLDLAGTHFTWTAHHFHLTRLSVLLLREIATTVPVFKTFMETARPTLRELNIEYVRWTSDKHFGNPRRSEDPTFIKLGRWKRYSSPVRFSPIFVICLASTPGDLSLVLSVTGIEDSRCGWSEEEELFLDRRQTAVSMGEWIDQLQINISRF